MGLVVTLGAEVTGVATRIETGEGLKVAATALHVQVVALVHVPDLFVPLPGRDYRIPGRRRIMTLGAIITAPLRVPGLVAVCADVVQSLKIRVLVTLETMQLTVGPCKLDRVARRIDF
jgi:hypothetical protein